MEGSESPNHIADILATPIGWETAKKVNDFRYNKTNKTKTNLKIVELKRQKWIPKPDISSCELGYHLRHSDPQLHCLPYHDNQLQDDQLGHN